jgi:hypothetical protein
MEIYSGSSKKVLARKYIELIARFPKRSRFFGVAPFLMKKGCVLFFYSEIIYYFY